MKPWLLAFACLLAPAALAQGYVVRETQLRYVQIFPTGSLFKDGFGLEGTVRRWQWDSVGYGLSLGLNDYSLDSNAPFVQGLRGGATLQGSAGYIPIQASLLYAPVRTQQLDVNVELGFRYMTALTSADVVLPVGDSELRQPIDIADAITVIGTVHVEYLLTSSIAISLGAGLQQDVITGEFGVNGVVQGDAELAGSFVQLGVVIDL